MGEVPRRGAAGAILAVLGAGLSVCDLASSALAAPAKNGARPVVKATPIPTYQIEALTTTGMGAMPIGGGNMVRVMLGGRPALATTTTRSLELRLDSPQVVAAPTAEHRIPAALAMGAALPLQSTRLGKGEPPTWKEQELVEGKGRMLLFRGCAESAGADQPEIVLMQGWTAEQKSQAMAGMKALAAMPWALDASGTSGLWPPTTESPPIPAQASLVGDHTVVSTYAPEIRFQVSTSHDFLAPLALKSEAGAAGAQRLSWQVVPTALGYQAMATGMGQQEGDIVMWTSSEGPRNDSWVPSDLQAPEAARLIQRRVLLGPERTSCAISALAMAAMKGGTMVTVTAYGDTLRLSSPKGAPAWQLSLERRSSATRPVGAGMEVLEGGGAGSQQEPPKRRGFNPLQLF
jgi:hypothetical protein